MAANRPEDPTLRPLWVGDEEMTIILAAMAKVAIQPKSQEIWLLLQIIQVKIVLYRLTYTVAAAGCFAFTLMLVRLI